MPGLRLGCGLGLTAGGGDATPFLAGLSLSSATAAEDAAQGTLVGTILGGSTGSTITLQAQETANAFQIDGGVIEVGSAGLDYETKTSHTITLRETLAEASNSPRDTVITISVTNVLEVTLGALSLDDLTHGPSDVQGTKVGGITGTTAGSTVTLHAQSVANAYQKDGSDIEIGSAGPLSAGERTITLRETHPDASNSPRDTVITITSEVALGNELFPQPAFDASTGITLNDWTISGGVANSNGSNSFMIATPEEAIEVATYRVTVDVTSNPSNGDLLVYVALGQAVNFEAVDVGVNSADLNVTTLTEQFIRLRNPDESGIILTSCSVKKIL